MKILLTTTPFENEYTYSLVNLPPLGLAQLAAMIKNKHTVKITDAHTHKYSIKNVLKTSIRDKPDVVGVSCGSNRVANGAIKMAKAIKQKYPDITLMTGGHHATFDYKNLLNNGFDYVVRHEGEYTFKELINWLDGKSNKDIRKIQGIAYKEGNKIRVNKDRPFIKNLDVLPFPARELLDNKNYWIPFYKKGNATCIETSRGCRHNCNFCYVGNMWGNRLRHKSPKRTLQELKSIEKNGFKSLFFVDDNFGANVKKTLKLCQLMLKNRISIRYYCQMRADTIVNNPSLIKSLAKTGIAFILIGFESINDKSLKLLKKGLTSMINKRVIKILKKNKIGIMGNFILGIPTETKKEMRKTINFAVDNVDFALFSSYQRYQGTESFLEERCASLPKMDVSIIKRMFVEAYFKFYLNKKQISNLIFGEAPLKNALKNFYKKGVMAYILNKKGYK